MGTILGLLDPEDGRVLQSVGNCYTSWHSITFKKPWMMRKFVDNCLTETFLSVLFNGAVGY
jgi:hypothetical protein